MKRFSYLAVFMLMSVLVCAQDDPKMFYWVVETNANDRTWSIVKFYDSADNLVKQEMLKRFIDIRRKQDKHRVIHMFDHFLREEGHAIMANRLKKKNEQ